MKSYVGKYRVVCNFEEESLKPILDDTYIYCSKGGQIYRWDRATLVYWNPNITGVHMEKLFKDAGVDILYAWGDECEIRFREQDLDKVAKIVKARTIGKTVKPSSKQNLELLKLRG